MKRILGLIIVMMLVISFKGIAEDFPFTTSDAYKIEWNGNSKNEHSRKAVGSDDTVSSKTEDDLLYQEEMEQIVSMIQLAVNESNIGCILDILDPGYQRECFISLEATHLLCDAFWDYIPIVSSARDEYGSFDGADVRLEYSDFEEEDDFGILRYIVSIAGQEEYTEEIYMVRDGDRWYITPSNYSDYFLEGDGYSLFRDKWAVLGVADEMVETFQRGNCIGLCTEDKEEIMSPYFEEIYGFTDGYCPVKIYGTWGFLNDKGEMVTNYIFDDVYEVPFGGFWWVKSDGQWGAVNFHTGEFVACQYDKVLYANAEKSMLSIEEDGSCGLVSGDGTVLIPFMYEDIGQPSLEATEKELIPVKENGFWSVVDLNNNAIAPFIYTAMDSRYYDDMLVVGVNDAYGAIGRDGQFLIRVNPEYRSSEYYDVYKIDQCLLQMVAYNGGWLETHMYDHNGNRLLSDYCITEGRNAGNAGKCYERLTAKRCLIYTDEPWNNKMTIGEDATGKHANCFCVDSDGNCINLSDIIIDSLSREYPETVELAKNESNRSEYTIAQVEEGVLKIYCYIYLHFYDYDSAVKFLGDQINDYSWDYELQLYNYMDYDGHFLLPNWIEADATHMLTDERILFMSSTGEDTAEISIFDISEGVYVIEKEPINISSAVLLVNYGSIRVIPGSHSYVINNTYDENIVVDMDNGIVYGSVGEYASQGYDLKIADMQEAIIVSDGVFYGLMTKDGLVGNGVMYTDWERFDDNGTYCLRYGAENETYYRILPDGSAEDLESESDWDTDSDYDDESYYGEYDYD